MTEDVRKKPVHIALLPATHIEKLKHSRRFHESAIHTKTARQVLPKKPKERKRSLIPKIKTNAGVIRKQTKERVRLQVWYDQIPPPDPTPPCDTCIAACCIAFLVDITPEEAATGLYDEYMIKITPEISTQINSSKFAKAMTMDNLYLFSKDTDIHFLEGAVGEPCPFLVDTKCSIYDDRPFTCRTYTCTGDPRITDAIRSGEQPL